MVASVRTDIKKARTLGTTSNLIMQYSYFWGTLMAAVMLASVPVAVLFLFFGIYVGGLTTRALTG